MIDTNCRELTMLKICHLLQGTAYWSAWNSRKGMSQEEAREEYVVAVRAMDPKHGSRCGTCVARKKV